MTDYIQVPKPPELLAAAEAMPSLFALLQRCFRVPEEYRLDLSSIDVQGLDDPVGIIAFAMRKIQALRFAVLQGSHPPTDLVVALISDVERVLNQVLDQASPLLKALEQPRPSQRDRERLAYCLELLNAAGNAVGRLFVARRGAVLLLVDGPDVTDPIVDHPEVENEVESDETGTRLTADE
jgi:hypothetical protein